MDGKSQDSETTTKNPKAQDDIVTVYRYKFYPLVI